ncbi:MAG: sulfite exporter TauE/SafE family protein [Pseudomonadota bacterium]
MFFIALSVILLGLAKGGFGGMGATVALPIMAIGVPVETALGALLPILMAMDVVSVTAHRKHADIPAILYALPGALIGVLLGAAVIAFVAPEWVGFCVGVLAIGFAIMAMTGVQLNTTAWPSWAASLFGGGSGFTSTIAHAGGPPIHMFFLTRGYTKEQFVGTSATFMAGVNVIKVVPFFVVGAMDRETLLLSLIIAPFAMLSAYIGVRVARLLSPRAFKIAVNALLILAGTKLIFDALS